MLFTASFWIIVAVSLFALEIFTGLFISLSFGISALMIAGIIYLYPDLIISYSELFFIFGLLGLVLSIIMWYFLGKRDTQPDINE